MRIALRPYIRPPSPEQLVGQRVRRCGMCWNLWIADQVQPDIDDQERCPNCRDDSATKNARAAREEMKAANAERYVPEVNESQAPIVLSIPATVQDIEDASGRSILPDPLKLIRGTPNTMGLRGVKFSAGDTFEYPSGVTDSIAPVLTGSTLWTLTLVAAPGMALGMYDLIFNDDTTLRDVFLVR